MPLQGYQDWERVSFQSGFNLLSIQTSITANRANGAFNTEAWANIQASCFAPGGSDHYQVMFVWYADQAATIELAQNYFVVGPNTICTMNVPVQGPWLWIFVNVKTGLNATAVNFTFYAQVPATNQFAMNTYTTPLIISNTAYGISAVNNFDATEVYSGNAFLHMRTSANNPATVNIQYWDWSTAALITYFAFDTAATTGEIREMIPLVAAPIRISVANGGVAQSILCSLVANE
jgi:hypothetical protein